jgi:hypothetical protein
VREEINTEFCLENLKEKDHLEVLGPSLKKNNIKMDLHKMGCKDGYWNLHERAIIKSPTQKSSVMWMPCKKITAMGQISNFGMPTHGFLAKTSMKRFA